MPSADPLILTAAFDPTAATTFQQLRDRHFPARVNIVPAHLTLFHHLPGSDVDAVAADLVATARARAPMPFRVSGLRFLGRGVAFAIHAPALDALRADLATRWRAGLGAQDRQPFKAHVTIQNKADPAAARSLRDSLALQPMPADGMLIGLDLWHYRNGPWEHAGRFAFAAEAG